ncbi:MAG: hypothetical protein K0S82_2500 [Gaiellaceae bacterium]|nr:hypothetical protein [Gaiellaceae bacterium]
MYMLDQYSTAHDQDRLGDWEDSSPEDVRSEVTRMREDFAEDRCEGERREPAAVG